MIGIKLRLFDGVTPRVNLTGLQAMYWDTEEPVYANRPTGKSILVATDSEGDVYIDLSDVTELGVGDYGFLTLYLLNISDPQQSLAFMGRVQLSEIPAGVYMPPQISTMDELTDINSGDYIEVFEDNGAGRYNNKKYDLAEIVTLKDTTVPAKADKLIFETAEKTADYILADGDQDKVVLMNKTGAATLTVPANDTVAFPVGTIIGVYNLSSDAVTIAGNAGVTVRNAGNLAQYGEVSLRKRATDEWVLVGVSNAGVLPPTNVTAEVSGSDIIVSWTAATFADGYHVYQQIDSGTWTKLNATATPDLTYTLTPTTPGEYNFLVTSVRGFTESAPGAETLYDEMMETVYTVTLSPRISAVDGMAFVDNVADVIGYADGNHLLEIEDSAGNVLSGVLSAQGSGETLGSELVTNGDFNSDVGWNQSAASWVISGGMATYDAINQLHYIRRSDSPLVQFALLKLFFSTITPDGTGRILITDGSGNTDIQPAKVVGTDSYVRYALLDSIQNGVRIYGYNTADPFSVDDISIKQVLAPSTSGATLVNEIFGDTQNLVSVDDGFAYNEASYTVRVKRILPAAEWTVDSGTVHIATKDGEAMFFHDTIPFSSYAGTDAGDTPYKLTFTDNAGLTAEAWAGAVGGGEALGGEFLTSITNSVSAPYETLTISGKDIIQAVNTDENGLAYSNKYLTVNALYLIDTDITLTSGSAPTMYTMRGSGASISRSLGTVTTTTRYETMIINPTTGYTDTGLGLYNIGTVCDYSLTWSCKKLTDIPATGLHLMSAKDGTTRNMAFVDAGFNPNTIVKITVSLP